jgi:RNA polymerase sigma factor (sigma-70 family)
MSEAAMPNSDLAPKAGGLRLHSDDRLARRAARGDDGAFETIYRRYHQDLYRFCLAMVGRPEDAQDALQNTMVKALRALPGETRRIKLKPWLYRIARNEAIEILRRRRDNAELAPEEVVQDGDIAETAEARERLRRLLDDLRELPDRQRAMLVMRELGGLGFDEIGEAFETSGSVARQTLYEARLSLRQMEAGREMDCHHVMKELSDADGRIFRRREIRAHLRGCADCRAFNDAIRRRQGELAAIAPLPVAASVGLLHGILGSGGAGGGAAATTGGGGVVGTLGAGTGKVVAGSALAKSVATVAVVAAVVTAADRSGLVDLPLLPGGSAGRAVESGSHGQSSSPANAHRARGAGAQSAAQGGKGSGGNATSQRRQAEGTANGQAGAAANGHSKALTHHHGHASARSASGTHGRPDELPPASSHGQQTAAAHKAPHANQSPGTPRGGSKVPPPAPAHSAPEPKPKPEVEDTTPAPTSPAAPEKPSAGGGKPEIAEEAASGHIEG